MWLDTQWQGYIFWNWTGKASLMCDKSWGMCSAHICDGTLLCHGQGAARRPALFKWKEKQETWWREVWVKAWKSQSISLDCTLNCNRASLACLDNDIFMLTFKILILAAVGRLQYRGKAKAGSPLEVRDDGFCTEKWEKYWEMEYLICIEKLYS